MKNIFENAKFGDKFKSIDGTIHQFICERPHGRFNLYNKTFNAIHVYNCNGIIQDKDKNSYHCFNIISELK